MTGQQELDSLKASGRARQREKRKDLIDAVPVGSGFNQARCQQRFNLGGEQQPVFGPASLSGPIQRTNAKAIPRQNEQVATLIPQGKGELTPQVLEHVLGMIFPKMGNDFRVTVSGKAMALRLQAGFQLGIIEQLAVKDHGNRAVLIGNGLPTVPQPDDAQATRSHTDGRAIKEAVFIRPAVDHRLRHCG